MKKNKGISLIVLVITIIVMIILAGSIVLTLSNNGIIDKAREAVDKSNLKSIENIATLAWADAYIVHGANQEKLQEAVTAALLVNNVTEQHYAGYILKVTTTGVKFLSEALNPTGTIPKGAIYTTASGTIISEGAQFPQEATTGDIYTYEDYEYRYNQYSSGSNWQTDTAQNGWAVRVIDNTKTSYGVILETINRAPVMNMSHTFYKCTSLVAAPKIPSGVTNMKDTFSGCTSLKNSPAIPSSVIDMYSTFYNCTSLATAPTIPDGVTTISYTFYKCTSLVTAPKIPSSVTNMNHAFYKCTSLITAPIIPNSVTYMADAFHGCTVLKTYAGSADPDGDFSNYIIPSSVTNMDSTFRECASFVIAPDMSKASGVTTIRNIFWDCIELTTASNLSNCTQLTEMSQAFYNCTSLETAPIISNSVVNMNYAFFGCTSLETAPEIPSSVRNMYNTFRNCTALISKPTIPSGVTTAESDIFSGCTQFGY